MYEVAVAGLSHGGISVVNGESLGGGEGPKRDGVSEVKAPRRGKKESG